MEMLFLAIVAVNVVGATGFACFIAYTTLAK